MVTFTDGASDRIYEKAEPIGFRIGPFPCQASELVQLKLNIESSVGDSTPTEAE